MQCKEADSMTVLWLQYTYMYVLWYSWCSQCVVLYILYCTYSYLVWTGDTHLSGPVVFQQARCLRSVTSMCILQCVFKAWLCLYGFTPFPHIFASCCYRRDRSVFLFHCMHACIKDLFTKMTQLYTDKIWWWGRTILLPFCQKKERKQSKRHFHISCYLGIFFCNSHYMLACTRLAKII